MIRSPCLFRCPSVACPIGGPTPFLSANTLSSCPTFSFFSIRPRSAGIRNATSDPSPVGPGHRLALFWRRIFLLSDQPLICAAMRFLPPPPPQEVTCVIKIVWARGVALNMKSRLSMARDRPSPYPTTCASYFFDCLSPCLAFDGTRYGRAWFGVIFLSHDLSLPYNAVFPLELLPELLPSKFFNLRGRGILFSARAGSFVVRVLRRGVLLGRRRAGPYNFGFLFSMFQLDEDNISIIGVFLVEGHRLFPLWPRMTVAPPLNMRTFPLSLSHSRALEASSSTPRPDYLLYFAY